MGDEADYGTISEDPNASTEENFVTIEVDEDAINRPTMAPVGSRLKRNAQIEYNPFDWGRTLFVVTGRPHVGKPFYVVSAIGTALVILSSIAGIGLSDDGECRAWCSRFALGSQPHQYIGFILFLIMAFRTKQAYQSYLIGQKAFYEIQRVTMVFVHTLLNLTPRDRISTKKRARILGYLISFPFFLTSELRRERDFDTAPLQSVLSEEDTDSIKASAVMPIFILESLSQIVNCYCKDLDSSTRSSLHTAITTLYKPYTDVERINANPMGFSYVAHVRLLLVIYLATLPLALVEQMGFSTIPVFWVVAYALMSLEMLAVEVENPFGYQGSDLRLYQYNIVLRDNVVESWKNWQSNVAKDHEDEERLDKYENFGGDDLDEEQLHKFFEFW